MTSTQVAIQADQGQVDQAMRWLLRLPQLPPNELPAIAEVRATVAAISEPANEAWCMARVAALLGPYYDKDTPPAVRKMDAEDWMEALAPFPQWAIERAARWWKSSENEDRRKKPLEGDIAARCKVEMRGIGAVPEILRWKATMGDHHPGHASPRITAERAAEIFAAAGFRPKRMEAQE